MAVCTRCNTSLSFIENLSHVGRTKFCSRCERLITGTLGWLHQQIMQAASQSRITEQFCRHVRQQLADCHIPSDLAAGLLQELGHQKNLMDSRLRYQKQLADSQLRYQKQLADIRQGYLSRVAVHAILDTDEYAHLDIPAVYCKPNKQVKYIEGEIIATNKKLYFITPDRNSMKIDWNNIVNVDERPGTAPTGQHTVLMHIQVAKGSGGGFYYVPDPTLAVAIITTAVRIWKRHLVELKENLNTQAIPEHVKAAVFQRDGGRCRQCGYVGQYIEYDHVIPRSKGGQNTVENIQLLCRQCNLKKSNRI